MVTKNTFSIVHHPTDIALMGFAFWLMTDVGANVQEETIEKGKSLYQRLRSAYHGKAGTGDEYVLFDLPPADSKAPVTQER